MVRITLRTIDALCLVGAYVAAASIVFLAVLGMTEIVLRSFFAYSLQFALEYGTYLLAVAMLAGSGWTLRSGGHIRISLLASALPASRARTLDLHHQLFQM